ncbi:uncharacterized protein BBOV_IV002600 [Babesia bovis T2Bo]|uniref:Uncharacterized protein n=1 Tax=Babesia bovis TaxID=5865 RepID=A7AVN1_BABBO|nr:uncharacterized protein BBOV_IV002600 [Babesia bovis T2Bo]EDO05857.1 hypothetical protein BBOV_IV002600 [Babesia bovis T2Bo]|eukprot:XP_001609425.1 hypothetical protein [Babesia bovis T2Bo]
MAGTLGGSIFTRLLSIWRSLRGEVVRMVDEATDNKTEPGCYQQSDANKFTADSRADSLSTTDGIDLSVEQNELSRASSECATPKSIDITNDFAVTIEQDKADAENAKEALCSTVEACRNNMPLDDLLQVSVGLHNNLETRLGSLCEKLNSIGAPIQAAKTELPLTIPANILENVAKEKALAHKRERCRRSPRTQHQTLNLDGKRPNKVAKKAGPTTLEQLELSKETRQLLELNSPQISKKD